jgi:hypothetical protein
MTRSAKRGACKVEWREWLDGLEHSEKPRAAAAGYLDVTKGA